MAGYGFVRRHGMILSRSSNERRFIMSLQNMFSNRSDYYINCGFKLNREFIFKYVWVTIVFFIIMVQFSPQRLQTETILECRNGTCIQIRISKAFQQGFSDLVLEKRQIEQRILEANTTTTVTPTTLETVTPATATTPTNTTLTTTTPTTTTPTTTTPTPTTAKVETNPLVPNKELKTILVDGEAGIKTYTSEMYSYPCGKIFPQYDVNFFIFKAYNKEKKEIYPNYDRGVHPCDSPEPPFLNVEDDEIYDAYYSPVSTTKFRDDCGNLPFRTPGPDKKLKPAELKYVYLKVERKEFMKLCCYEYSAQDKAVSYCNIAPGDDYTALSPGEFQKNFKARCSGDRNRNPDVGCKEEDVFDALGRNIPTP